MNASWRIIILPNWRIRFALFLRVEQLAFAGHVAAVAFGGGGDA